MKYLITENQQQNAIKKFISTNFDKVDDVWFTTRNVYYGSGPVNGKNRGEEIIINVLIDNAFLNEDETLNTWELRELKNKIIKTTDKTFGLGYDRYGGGWGFSFFKKTIESF